MTRIVSHLVAAFAAIFLTAASISSIATVPAAQALGSIPALA